MFILGLKMAMDLSENIFIWSAVKRCTKESGIIHFNILFWLKMAILGLKMVILDLKMAMDLSKNIFIWLAVKSCIMESGIINY